jgi:uncharacterized BrkB/YihY/UPF0761 family membrane protein
MYSAYLFVVLFIVLWIASLFLLELMASLNDIPGDNVNVIIRQYALDKYFFITMFFGICTGHLFLGTHDRVVDWSGLFNSAWGNRTWDMIFVIVICLICLLLGHLKLFSTQTKTKKFQLIVFSLGVTLGHYFWSMKIFAHG